MHLIFAIILLSIILVARWSSSGSKAASNKRVKKMIEDKKSWIFWNRLDPREQGYDVKSYVDNPDNREAILAEVKECYDSIFEKKPFRQLCPPQTWINPNLQEQIAERSFRLNKKRASLILCAKRGYAYSAGWSNYYGYYEAIDVQVMLWCRDELRKHGKKLCVLKSTKSAMELLWAPESWKSCSWLQSEIVLHGLTEVHQ